MKTFLSVFVATAALSLFAVTASAEDLIDFEKFTLPNGLSVIVHEDHNTPKVSVGVWYHVGSKDEPDGKTGFAHLFEHLMFNGSENHDKEYFPPLQEIGASEVNGTTWLDRTNYYQTVPTGGLERVLWLEADRMGHLLGAITQDKLDEQRAVVKNEKRTADNRPYGLKQYRVWEGTFPEDHPYHHSTIGSMEDLDAASLEDVKGWFEKYYGAANAVLVMSGDINVEEARALATQYFGHIPSGPPVARLESWVPEKTVDTEEVMYDNVPQTVVSWNWPVTGGNGGDAEALRAAAQILGFGKSSRLYQKLVQEHQLASSASVSYQGFEIAGLFSIDVTLNDGVEPADVEPLIQGILDDFIENGPHKDELDRVKAVYYSNMVRAFQSISIRGHALAQSELFTGDPGAYADDLKKFEALTTQDAMIAARKYLSGGKHELTIKPFGNHQASAEDARPASLPGLLEEADLVMPEVVSTTLSNGIRVNLVERHTLPLIEMSMSFDAGGAAEQHFKPGLASFTLGLMDEGTSQYTSKELAEAQDSLGARISSYSDDDTTKIALSATTRQLRPSIELWADYIRNPAFREEDLERDKALTLSALSRSMSDPGSIAWNVFSHLLYGDDHPYGTTLSGREDAIRSFTREEVQRFYQSWIRPDTATITVVGDISLAEATSVLERAFGSWKAPSTAPGSKFVDQEPETAAGGTVILIDKPGAVQSAIRVGHLMPNGLSEDDFDIRAMNDVLGGSFTSRLNMNLREDKGWAYGAGSAISSARGPQAFSASVSVQMDKTAEAMAEIDREIRDLAGTRPPNEEEIDLIVKGETLSLPGRFETNWSVMRYMQYVERLGLPFDHIETLAGRYHALTPSGVGATATKYLRPDDLVWVVVGDLSKVEDEIRAGDFGTVEIWSPEGERLR